MAIDSPSPADMNTNDSGNTKITSADEILSGWLGGRSHLTQKKIATV